VRYNQDYLYHDYYLYDLNTKQCVGLFTLERPFSLSILQPGVQAVTPHMVLAPTAQRQGIATRIYTSFLLGGSWVFATFSHTVGASRLWDSLVQGSIVSFYFNRQTGELVDDPDDKSTEDDLRVLGPRDRFRPQVLTNLQQQRL
jgi:hypothetical protein